jgi:hypothetical protein
MVVFALPSVAGLQRWTDYIPIKFQNTGSDIANSFDTNGYIACDFLTSTTGKQSWVDYIPVYVDRAATVAWQVSDDGYLPFNTLPGGGLIDPPLFLLMETGDFLLQEDGSKIIITIQGYLTQQDDFKLLQEDGSNINLEGVSYA